MAVSKVTRSFPCTVEQLWQIVTDLTHTDWRSDLARVEVLDETRFVSIPRAAMLPILRLQPVNQNSFGPSRWKTGTCPAPGRDGSRRWKVVPG